MLAVRASSAPAATRCIHSLDTPRLSIEQINDAQLNGTYVHAMLAAYISGDPIPEAPNEDTNILFNCGAKMWRAVEKYFPGPMVEQELSAEYPGLRLTGHSDVASIVTLRNKTVDARVWDNKSGRVHGDTKPQLLTYAVMIADDLGADSATIFTGWLREMEYEVIHFSALELQEEKRRLIANLTNPNAPYCTGDHCGYCRMRHECPARQQITATAAFALTGHPEINLRAIEGERLGRLLTQSKLMQSAIYAIDAAVRSEIQAGGPLDIGDAMLTLKEEQRREIDNQAALRALWGVYGDKVLDYASITCGAIDRLAGDSVEKGKGDARDELRKTLFDKGIITHKTIYKLVRGKKEIESND